MDDIFTAGTYKDVPVYKQVDKVLHPAGSKFKVLAYSKLAEKVFKAGETITVPHYAAYASVVYAPGGAINGYKAAPGGTYYKSAGTAEAYQGNGAEGYLRGDAIIGTNQGSKVQTQYYRKDSYGENYGKMSKVIGAMYWGGSSYTYYKGNGGYVVGRGSKVTHNLREPYAAAGLFVVDEGKMYNLLGAAVNGTSGTTLYTRDAANDEQYTAIGAEVANVYERDEDGDYDVTPVHPAVSYSQAFIKSGDTERLYTMGKKCTFTPAKVVTQEVTTLVSK